MKRYYGEEAEILTDEDHKLFDARIARMKAGTYDFGSLVVEAPPVVVIAEIVIPCAF